MSSGTDRAGMLALGPRLGELGGARPTQDSPLSEAQAVALATAIGWLQVDDARAALQALAPLVAAERADEWVANTRAVAHLMAGEPAAAAAVLGPALDRFPGNGYLQLNMAWAQLGQGRAREAIPYLENFTASALVDLDASVSRRAFTVLVMAYLNTGSLSRAERTLVGAQQRYGYDPWLGQLSAQIAFERGDLTRFAARAEVAQALFLANRGLPTRGDMVDLETVPAVLRASGRYSLPLAGRMRVERPALHVGLVDRFAVDIELLSDGIDMEPVDGRREGSPVASWIGFGAPVLAARAGVVVEIVDGSPDLERAYEPLLGGNGEPLHAPANRVVIVHEDGERSEYLHLKRGSVTVTLGAEVRAGEVIGAVGASGTGVDRPHLGFRVTRLMGGGAHGVASAEGWPLGLRFTFGDVRVRLARTFRAPGPFDPYPLAVALTVEGRLRSTNLE